MNRYKLLFVSVNGIQNLHNEPIFTIANDIEEATRFGNDLKYEHEEVIVVPYL